MNIKTVNLSQIKPSEKNVRMHSEAQIKEFKRSVEKFGQIRPIVTDENLTILAGHGLWESMQEMGLKKGQVLIMQGLSEADKKKLMLADNKIYEMGMTDLSNMMEILEEIKMGDSELDIPGYDMDVLNSLLAETDELDENIMDYGNVSEEKIEEIKENDEKQEKLMETPPPKEIVLNNEKIQVEQKENTDVPKPFVVCTKCGEKIWL